MQCIKTECKGFKHWETDESTRPQAECFYAEVFGTPDETRNTSFWDDFSNEIIKKCAVIDFFAIVLLNWKNNRCKLAILRNINSTYMINCIGVVGVWPWVKMERQDLCSRNSLRRTRVSWKIYSFVNQV